MMIKVRLNNAEKDIEIEGGSTSEDVLKALTLLPDAHLMVRNNAPIPLDAPLRDGDSIKIIKVASGG